MGSVLGKPPLPPYSHDSLLEVASEGVRLVELDLAVLHGAAPQVVVQLRGVDGRAALLVLGGVLPDPEVDVLGEAAARFPGLGRDQRGRSGASFPLARDGTASNSCAQWVWVLPPLSVVLSCAPCLGSPNLAGGKLIASCSQNKPRARELITDVRLSCAPDRTARTQRRVTNGARILTGMGT